MTAATPRLPIDHSLMLSAKLGSVRMRDLTFPVLWLGERGGSLVKLIHVLDEYQIAALAGSTANGGVRPLVLIRGLSGSGKSTLAGLLASKLAEMSLGIHARVVEADQYFMVGGEYRFDSTRLRQAHLYCMKTAEETPLSSVVIVANTNRPMRDMQPYVEMAGRQGREVIVIDVGMGGTTVDGLAARNVHGLTGAMIQGQVGNYASLGDMIDPMGLRYQSARGWSRLM